MNETTNEFIRLEKYKIAVVNAFTSEIRHEGIKVCHKQLQKNIKDYYIIKDRLHQMNCLLEKINRENKPLSKRLLNKLVDSCEKLYKIIDKCNL